MDIRQATEILRKQHHETENDEAERLCELGVFLDKTCIPPLPGFYWHEARHSYVYGLFNGAIALSGMAAESSLRDFVSQSLRSPCYLNALFDQIEFVRLIQIAKKWRIIENQTARKFDKIRNLRNKYTHSNVEKIIEPLRKKMGEITEIEQDTGRIVSRHTFGLDKEEKAIGVLLQSQDDALEAIKLVEEVFVDVFVHKGSLKISNLEIPHWNLKSVLFETSDRICFEGFGFGAEGERIVDELEQLKKKKDLAFIAYDVKRKRIEGHCGIFKLDFKELSKGEAPVKHMFYGTLKARIQPIR